MIIPKYDRILKQLRESDWTSSVNISPWVSWYTFINYIQSKTIDWNNASLNDVINILGTIVNDLNWSSINVKKQPIIIRWEVLADVNYSQWIYLYNHLNTNMIIDNIEVVVWNSTDWNLKLNLYKSSWVNWDWIDNNSTKICTNDINLSNWVYKINTIPDINILEPWKYLSLRITEATGTVLANDLTCIITYLW